MSPFLPHLGHRGVCNIRTSLGNRRYRRRVFVIVRRSMVSSLTKRLVMGLVLLVIVVVGGGIGYYLIGGGAWRLVDCIYMTVITVTTVGYGEVLEDMDRVAYARAFTMI